MTAKPLDRAHAYGVAEIDALIRELTQFIDIYERFKSLIAAQPGETLAAHNHRGIERGLAGFRSSISAVEKSIRFAQLGAPILENELKPRSPGRSKTSGLKTKTKRGRKI